MGTTEDEMIGWHHWLSGCEFEQALGVGDGQESLVCCSPWGHRELDRSERLNCIDDVIWSFPGGASGKEPRCQCRRHKRLRLLAHSHSNSRPLSWWCYPTVSSSVTSFFLLPSVFPSIRVFSIELALCIRWPKYWSFNFSISPSNEYSWLISIRIDLFDLLAVQGALKSLLQHHSSKVSILQHSAFLIVQLSHPDSHTWQLEKP